MKYNLPNHFDIKALLLMSLDLSEYDIPNWKSLDLQTQINHARAIFESEMLSKAERKPDRKLNDYSNATLERKRLCDWLQGACQLFLIPHYTCEIEQWFAVTINRPYRPKEFSDWLERYYSRLASWLWDILYTDTWMRKHKGRDLLTMDFDQEIKSLKAKIASLPK